MEAVKRSLPLNAPLPNRAGDEKGHSAAPIKRSPAFHTRKAASPAGTRAHYTVKGLSPLLTMDTLLPLTFKKTVVFKVFLALTTEEWGHFYFQSSTGIPWGLALLDPKY